MSKKINLELIANDSIDYFNSATSNLSTLNKEIETRHKLQNIYSAEIENMNEYLIKWGNYNQKIKALNDKYSQMISQESDPYKKRDLEKQLEQELTDINVDKLMKNSDWEKLFDNIDFVSNNALLEIINNLKQNTKELHKEGKITIDTYFGILKKIERREKRILSKKPIAVAANSLNTIFKKIDVPKENTKEYENALKEKKRALKEFSVASAESLGQLNASMKSIKPLADIIGADDQTKEQLNSVANMIGGAAKLSSGLMTGNIGAVLSGGVEMIAGAINVFDSRSRRANDIIQTEQNNIDVLKQKYNELENEIDRALGSEQYAKQIDQAENMQAQIEAIDRQIEAERGKRKRKRDDEQIAEWQNQQEKLKQSIIDTKQAVIDELATTDLKSFSYDLGKSIVDGISEGVDNTSDIIDGKMDDLLRAMIAKQFDMLVMQKAFAGTFDAIEKGLDESSDGGFELTQGELENIKNQGEAAKNVVQGSVDGLQKLLESLGLIKEEERESNNSNYKSKGQLTTMSQEQIARNEGILTSIQLNVATMTSGVDSLVSIGNSISNNVDTIKENSRYLKDISDDIKTIKRDGLKAK